MAQYLSNYCGTKCLEWWNTGDYRHKELLLEIVSVKLRQHRRGQSHNNHYIYSDIVARGLKDENVVVRDVSFEVFKYAPHCCQGYILEQCFDILMERFLIWPLSQETISVGYNQELLQQSILRSLLKVKTDLIEKCEEKVMDLVKLWMCPDMVYLKNALVMAFKDIPDHVQKYIDLYQGILVNGIDKYILAGAGHVELDPISPNIMKHLGNTTEILDQYRIIKIISLLGSQEYIKLNIQSICNWLFHSLDVNFGKSINGYDSKLYMMIFQCIRQYITPLSQHETFLNQFINFIVKLFFPTNNLDNSCINMILSIIYQLKSLSSSTTITDKISTNNFKLFEQLYKLILDKKFQLTLRVSEKKAEVFLALLNHLTSVINFTKEQSQLYITGLIQHLNDKSYSDSIFKYILLESLSNLLRVYSDCNKNSNNNNNNNYEELIKQSQQIYQLIEPMSKIKNNTIKYHGHVYSIVSSLLNLYDQFQVIENTVTQASHHNLLHLAFVFSFTCLLTSNYLALVESAVVQFQRILSNPRYVQKLSSISQYKTLFQFKGDQYQTFYVNMVRVSEHSKLFLLLLSDFLADDTHSISIVKILNGVLSTQSSIQNTFTFNGEQPVYDPHYESYSYIWVNNRVEMNPTHSNNNNNEFSINYITMICKLVSEHNQKYPNTIKKDIFDSFFRYLMDSISRLLIDTTKDTLKQSLYSLFLVFPLKFTTLVPEFLRDKSTVMTSKIFGFLLELDLMLFKHYHKTSMGLMESDVEYSSQTSVVFQSIIDVVKYGCYQDRIVLLFEHCKVNHIKLDIQLFNDFMLIIFGNIPENGVALEKFYQLFPDHCHQSKNYFNLYDRIPVLEKLQFLKQNPSYKVVVDRYSIPVHSNLPPLSKLLYKKIILHQLKNIDSMDISLKYFPSVNTWLILSASLVSWQFFQLVSEILESDPSFTSFSPLYVSSKYCLVKNLKFINENPHSMDLDNFIKQYENPEFIQISSLNQKSLVTKFGLTNLHTLSIKPSFRNDYIGVGYWKALFRLAPELTIVNFQLDHNIKFQGDDGTKPTSKVCFLQALLDDSIQHSPIDFVRMEIDERCGEISELAKLVSSKFQQIRFDYIFKLHQLMKVSSSFPISSPNTNNDSNNNSEDKDYSLSLKQFYNLDLVTALKIENIQLQWELPIFSNLKSLTIQDSSNKAFDNPNNLSTIIQKSKNLYYLDLVVTYTPSLEYLLEESIPKNHSLYSISFTFFTQLSSFFSPSITNNSTPVGDHYSVISAVKLYEPIQKILHITCQSPTIQYIHLSLSNRNLICNWKEMDDILSNQDCKFKPLDRELNLTTLIRYK
ncbi:hypothetical protein DLAC_06728 [Tieghemostelium lacteum]|uniref:Uncharacterized protein n=1 Tax=Tieghemostelium lacteum TaxID=361077 RepID=A0A151ZFL4_TIELA|nr:hypothetical protein DLAC_06728 [Tieghemostelium lacteum]|eukprot:KYQ92725.1 hypothetical protein DLAC_06728 [Tieghemostelium lacteum]